MQRETQTGREGAVKPQGLVLSLFGNASLQPASGWISAKTLLHVLRQVGVADPASRSTFARMTDRGLLEAQRSGRSVSYHPTKKLQEVLAEGSARLFPGEPSEAQSSIWTLVTLNVPESQRAHRHSLRGVLRWSGFAPLGNGIWIAPGRRPTIIGRIAAANEGEDDPVAPMVFFSTEETDLLDGARVSDLWNLDEVRSRHEAFLAQWSEDRDPALGALAQHVLLASEWLDVLTHDPGLPEALLPPEWPASLSRRVFRDRFQELLPEARAEFHALESVSRSPESAHSAVPQA